MLDESSPSNVPDVLLLDLMLPDGNGLELLEELRDSAVKRVVFITGHPGIKSLIKNLSGPSVSYLTKPIDSRELIALLNEVDANGAGTGVASGAASGADSRHFGLLIGESAADASRVSADRKGGANGESRLRARRDRYG